MKKQRSYKPFSIRRQEKKAKRKILFTLFIGGLIFYATIFWILPTFIGGLSFLNRYKPSPQSSPPISEDTKLAPPVLNIPFEATNTAIITIKGYTLPRAKVEIFLDDSLKGTIEAKEDGSFTYPDLFLNLGTNNIFGKTIDEKGNRSLPSKTIKVSFDNEAPELELNEPQDNQVFKENRKINITGKVNLSDAALVTINNSRAIVNSEGHFSKTIDLHDGENEIIVKASDPAGNTTQLTRRVIFEP